MTTKKLFSLLFFCLATALQSQATYQPRFSTAGFYALPGTGRQAYSMNPAWRFMKGNVPEAYAANFNDKAWAVVALPHGIENLPSEASGCVNYQGVVWYRKHFTPRSDWQGKRLQLHFEAIMGKCQIWLNGKKVAEHEGGYTPVIIDLTDRLLQGKDNVIAVRADNSDDGTYPPGKPQDALDFTYAGGIYRDCWLVATNKVFITNPNEEDVTAGGGLFVSYNHVSTSSADIHLDLQVRNRLRRNFKGRAVYELVDAEGNTVKTLSHSLKVVSGKTASISDKFTVKTPHLWEPDNPYLYRLRVYLKNEQGETVDGYYQRIGIRSIEFKGKDGFWLNGKPYPEPLIGANRHQDFAVVGNALSNSLHWRDAKKLRDAGLRVIRNAHYPQDPAFMDACDELGLFVIVNTPGWQYWNKDPKFAQLVYRDIRNIVRRDRNHASVWLWEPILNETWYPEDFAKRVHDLIDEEYPYPYAYSACDASARGADNFSILFTHPLDADKMDPKITYFTREWGDNVDDWNSHNSPSRVSRAWGEVPMMVQAQGYAKPDYPYTCYDLFYQVSRQHVGGCLWHSFDHQRGYHPDPFYGGIMDNFRQPKYSYYMFCAQRPAEKNKHLIADNGPMIYIANAMTPFSPADVTVYSNCDEVRLTYCKGGKAYTYKKDKSIGGMPSPIITFKDVFHFMDDKALDRDQKGDDSYLLAEGLINGKVVATHKVMPARRPTQLRLTADNEGMEMRADGSDLMTVVAAVTDDNGNVKRLNNQEIIFSIEGPGELVADEQSFTNPRRVEWGTAPILVRSTTEPGTIRVKASVVWNGKETPLPGELTITTTKADNELVFTTQQQTGGEKVSNGVRLHGSNPKSSSKSNLNEVARQQAEFE